MAGAKKRPRSASRSHLAQRPRAEWLGRGAIAAAVVIVGYVGVSTSLAQVLSKVDVERAHRLAPHDGRITGQLAATLTANAEATPADRRRASTLAEAALRQAPMTVVAASSLGINRQVQGEEASARRLLAYSQRLSRREPLTMLWAIEDAVTRGDVKGALRNYDITLRVKPQFADLLFPVLTAASSDPAIQGELVNLLATRPTWGEGFATFVSRNATDPAQAAALLSRARAAGAPVPGEAQLTLVNTLIGNGLNDHAWAYYATLRRGADRRMSRDPRFSAGLETPTLLDWRVVDAEGLSATMQDGLDIWAPPSIGGAVVSQMQLLPAGRYRLVGQSEGIEKANSPYWSLGCYKGRELGRVSIPNSNHSNGRFAGEFIVPADCPVQVLTLIVRATTAATGLSGRMRQTQLAPAR